VQISKSEKNHRFRWVGGVDDFFLKADLGDVRADCVFEEKKTITSASLMNRDT